MTDLALPRLQRVFRSAKSYAILDGCGARGGTWLAGGCWVAAAALQRVLGGDLVGVYSKHGIEHVALQVDGTIMDARLRPLSAQRFLADYAKMERLADVALGPLDVADADTRGIPYDPRSVKDLATLLIKAVPRA